MYINQGSSQNLRRHITHTPCDHKLQMGGKRACM